MCCMHYCSEKKMFMVKSGKDLMRLCHLRKKNGLFSRQICIFFISTLNRKLQ